MNTIKSVDAAKDVTNCFVFFQYELAKCRAPKNTRRHRQCGFMRYQTGYGGATPYY